VRRRFYSQVYLGLLITAVLCAELTFFALLAEGALRTDGDTNVVARAPSTGDAVAGAVADPSPLVADPSPLAAEASALAAEASDETGLRQSLVSAARAVPPLVRAQVFVLIVLVSIAIGAVPMAHRTTRRLERLQTSVEELAAGDLRTRVAVDGEDEIAELARSFNKAASQIERLVVAQRRLLASASHELRTPLTHVRVTLGLLADEMLEVAEGTGPRLDPSEREKLLADADADIEELDALIGDLLLTSRLTAGSALVALREVDLKEALAEVAARFGVTLVGEGATIPGDRRALQRMARNLLENARRHGGSRALEASLEPLPDCGARLIVSDRGPGVADEDRERIFEPFYRSDHHDEGSDPGIGLGLALVREIARFHGGEVRCLRRSGGGTRFEVDLVGAEEGPARPAART